MGGAWAPRGAWRFPASLNSLFAYPGTSPETEGAGGRSLLTLTSPPPSPASQVLESQLQRPLPEDLAEALANGVILCQLANQLRPRSVPFIHVPSPAVVSWGPGRK